MEPQPLTQDSPPVWSRGKRAVASVAILLYLAVVFSGPATTVSSDLNQSLHRATGPAQQLLFLGHGYRFFAPNPGPSHILQYEVGFSDQTTTTGKIPDTEVHWPRQLYHRWFMLSERLFEESTSLPSQQDFDQSQKVLRDQEELFIRKGKRGHANRIAAVRMDQETGYRQSVKRVQELVDSIGQHLIREHGADWVKLTVHERAIPFPADVVLGDGLDEPHRLSDPIQSWVIEAPRQ